MKTVLIIGAGISRAAAPERAAIRNRPPLDVDFAQIALAAYPEQFKKISDQLKAFVADYSETLLTSLETTTTYLYLKALDSAPKSAEHIAFLQLLELIGLVLAHTTNRIKLAPRSLLYRFLLSELKRVPNPQDLTIITFNYDLLIERALLLLGQNQHCETFVFPHSYRLPKVAATPGISGLEKFPTRAGHGKGIALLKLHGSINWQSVHTSQLPNPSALFNPKRELHVINSPMARATLSWIRRRRRVYLQPIIVPPISGKRGTMHAGIPVLWKLAGQALREADRVVIGGYSCPPLDLEARFLLGENLRANKAKRIYVVDPNPDIVSRYVPLCGVDHITNYRSLRAWVDDSAKYPSV